MFPWWSCAIAVVVLTSVHRGATDDPHPRGLSDRFPDNHPYLQNQTRRNNATMSFDLHTGDLLTPAAAAKTEGKVISSVRLLIQVINGTLSNRTMDASKDGSSFAADVHVDSTGTTGGRKHGQSTVDEEVAVDRLDGVASEDISHVSDENGEMVNLTLGRRDKSSGGRQQTSLNDPLARRKATTDANDIQDGQEDEESDQDTTEAGETQYSSRKDLQMSKGKLKKTTTEASYLQGGQENDGDQDSSYAATTPCDCDEEEDANRGDSGQSEDEANNESGGKHGGNQHSATNKPKQSQKIDLANSLDAGEDDDDQDNEDDSQDAATDNRQPGHPKKGIDGAAVSSDDTQYTSNTITYPPLRRRSTTNKPDAGSYGNSGRTTTASMSADLGLLDEQEREEAESDDETEIEEEKNADAISGSTSEGGKNPVCFGDWSSWTACKPINQTHSVRERARFKLLSDADPVPEINLQSQSCEDSELALIPGMLSEWSDWSSCSKSCDGGISTRYRAIIGSHYKDSNSLQVPTETRPCGQKKCIKIVETPTFLGEWSQWSACSRSCGGGLQTRYKQCILVSSAQYVSDPNNPVLETVVIPKPRPVPRERCTANSSSTEGIEVTCCAVIFCPGNLEVFNERYEYEVLTSTPASDAPSEFYNASGQLPPPPSLVDPSTEMRPPMPPPVMLPPPSPSGDMRNIPSVMLPPPVDNRGNMTQMFPPAPPGPIRPLMPLPVMQPPPYFPGNNRGNMTNTMPQVRPGDQRPPMPPAPPATFLQDLRPSFMAPPGNNRGNMTMMNPQAPAEDNRPPPVMMPPILPDNMRPGSPVMVAQVPNRPEMIAPAPATSPPMIYHFPARYSQSAAPAPLEYKSMQQYKEENQIDYNDYDELH